VGGGVVGRRAARPPPPPPPPQPPNPNPQSPIFIYPFYDKNY